MPTVEHWNSFRPRMVAEGVDVEAAQKRADVIVDADELLPRFTRNSMRTLRVPRFGGGSSRCPVVTATPRCGGGARCDVLWERGEVAADMNLEDLFDSSACAQSQDIAIFCSFLMDNFNGDIQSRILPRLGENVSPGRRLCEAGT